MSGRRTGRPRRPGGARTEVRLTLVAKARDTQVAPGASPSGNGDAGAAPRAPTVARRSVDTVTDAPSTPVAAAASALSADDRRLLGDLFAVLEEHAGEGAPGATAT